MNFVVRRRVAAGALLASTALVASLVIAPSSNAAAGGVTITPSGASNTEAAAVLTYKTTQADLQCGGTATFTRNGGGVPFDSAIKGGTLPGVGTGTADRESTSDENFTDEGAGIGSDGPADAGTYNVSVTGTDCDLPPSTGGNDTCTTCFTVASAGPVSFASVTPNTIKPGTQRNITITGNNFEKGSTIEFLMPDGSVDTLLTGNFEPTANDSDTGTATKEAITTRTKLLRRAKVTSADTPGFRGIRITNLDGNSTICTACFTVTGAPLTGVSPTFGVNDPGSNVTVTFTGSNVVNGTPRLQYTGNAGSSTADGLSIDPVPGTTTTSTGSSISAQFDLSNAAPGSYQGMVRDSSSGVTNVCEQPACPLFTVDQQSSRNPTVTGLDRDASVAGNQKDQPAGTTRTFDVIGTNFSKGVQIKTTATNVTVTAVEFVSPTLVHATITAASNATAGDYNVTATLTDGTVSAACTGCYTVTAAAASPSASSTATSTACPSASASGSATPAASASASATPSASSSASATTAPLVMVPFSSHTPSASASASTTPSSSASASASSSASASASASSSASASGTPSPSSSCATRRTATLRVEDSTIPAGSTARLFATGAPNQAYSLRCYTRPSTEYKEARSGSFDSAGSPVTFVLSLGRNTRCFLQYVSNPGQGASPSVVVNVSTVLSLSTVRQAVRTYLFQGRNLPRVSGQLITLYRVDATGREIRTSNLTTDNSGIYKVTRKFTGTGTFKFRVRTSQTLNNAAGVSNTINVRVY